MSDPVQGGGELSSPDSSGELIAPLNSSRHLRMANSTFPMVTVIVPCRNEEKFIASCLDSILANDYPKDRLEILVVDGMSEDRTKELVAQYERRYPLIHRVENSQRTIPAAMNTGIQHARGSVIMKMDAHSLFDPRHISTCVRYQQQSGAENVGGVWQIQPGADSDIARAIVLALGSRFGSGNARIKVWPKGPTFSDSVAFGCYRKEFLEKVGGFDERLLGSSDMDLNRRIHAAGGRILLLPEIVVQYFSDPTWRAYVQHNFADGVWTSYVQKFGSRAWAWRHWVPAALVGSLVGSLLLSLVWHKILWLFLVSAGTYVVASLMVSALIALREGQAKSMHLLPAVFAARHLVYGLGTLYGIVLLVIPGQHWKGRRSAKG